VVASPPRKEYLVLIDGRLDKPQRWSDMLPKGVILPQPGIET